MATTQLVAQAVGGTTDAGLITLGAFVAAGLMLAGGAIGAASGNGSIGAAAVSGIARQPGARGSITAASLVYVALVEAAYFINLAFAALMIFFLAGG